MLKVATLHWVMILCRVPTFGEGSPLTDIKEIIFLLLGIGDTTSRSIFYGRQSTNTYSKFNSYSSSIATAVRYHSLLISIHCSRHSFVAEQISCGSPYSFVANHIHSVKEWSHLQADWISTADRVITSVQFRFHVLLCMVIYWYHPLISDCDQSTNKILKLPAYSNLIEI